MLKGISPLISPELMDVLMRMGHGDDLVLADGNFPAETMGQRVVRCDGHGVPALLEAILPLLPIDDFVDDPVQVMQPVDPDAAEPPIWNEFRAKLDQHAERPLVLNPVERFEFYRRAQQAFAVVATGETAIYANLLIKKGVVAT